MCPDDVALGAALSGLSTFRPELTEPRHVPPSLHCGAAEAVSKTTYGCPACTIVDIREEKGIIQGSLPLPQKHISISDSRL